MRNKIKILSLVILLLLTVGFTFAWYETQDLTQGVVLDTVEVTLISSENTDKELVPEGYAWFTDQTESYTYVYNFSAVLVPTKEFVVDYTFINVTTPATVELYEQYFIVNYTILEVNGETQITIIVTLLDTESRSDYLKLSKSSGEISFEFSTINI